MYSLLPGRQRLIVSSLRSIEEQEYSHIAFIYWEVAICQICSDENDVANWNGSALIAATPNKITRAVFEINYAGVHLHATRANIITWTMLNQTQVMPENQQAQSYLSEFIVWTEFNLVDLFNHTF